MIMPSTYRAMEGAIELQFCDDDGEVHATKEQQQKFLEDEGFSILVIEEYLTFFNI